jgi:hypothetical protein
MTSIISLDQKVRNRDPKVAKKMKDRRVMNRAWEIAKNSYNAHNASAETVAKLGAAKSSRDFFIASLQLAWDEEKSSTKIYVKIGSLPRKVMPRIHQEMATLINTNAMNGMTKETANYNMAKAALYARYGKEKVTDSMLEQVYVWAYGEAEHEQLSLLG